MTSDSPPDSPSSPSRPPPQPAAAGHVTQRRLSTAGVPPPLTASSRCAAAAASPSVGRRRKTATAVGLQGSSIVALAAVARTPLLIGAVNHRKKSLPDNVLLSRVHSQATGRQRKVLHLPVSGGHLEEGASSIKWGVWGHPPPE